MPVFKPGDCNGQGTKTVGQIWESLFIWRVLFARARIKGLQLRPMEKIPPVVSLNACMLRVSHGTKFKVAKKCLYSKEEEWLQMLSTSSFPHSVWAAPGLWKHPPVKHWVTDLVKCLSGAETHSVAETITISSCLPHSTDERYRACSRDSFPKMPWFMV